MLSREFCFTGAVNLGDSSWSAETDLAHAILKILGSCENLYFDAHEIDGKISPVEFGKSYGVLLGCDNDFRLPLLASVNNVKDFLLGKPMVICEPFGIDQFAS